MRILRLPFSGSFMLYAVCDGRGVPLLLEFFHGLGANLLKDVDRMMALLESVALSGPPRNTDVSHQLRGEIYEFIQGRLRVLWFYDKGRVVVCSHGMVKQSQKTPRSEIERAEEVRHAFLAAKQADQLLIEEENDD